MKLSELKRLDAIIKEICPDLSQYLFEILQIRLYPDFDKEDVAAALKEMEAI